MLKTLVKSRVELFIKHAVNGKIFIVNYIIIGVKKQVFEEFLYELSVKNLMTRSDFYGSQGRKYLQEKR